MHKLLLPIILASGCGTPAAPQAPQAPQTPVSNPHGDRSVVNLVVTMAIKPEREQEFLELARVVAAKVHTDEPGVLLYVLTKHPTEPSTYVWLERYRDAAAFETHMQSPHLKAALEKLPDLVAKPPVGMKLEQILPE